MQSDWFKENLGCCYKITFKDGRVFIYHAGEIDIRESLYGVDISDSAVKEVDCMNIEQFGWQ